MSEEPQPPAAVTIRGRLPLRTSQDTEGDVARLLGKLEQSDSAFAILRTLANSPGLFRPFVLYASSYQDRSLLPYKVKEIVVLYLAARANSAYEWYEHVAISAQAGVSDEQQATLKLGDDYDRSLFEHQELVALAVSSRLMIADDLPDALWKEAVDLWTDSGALDLVMAVGWWGRLIPMVINALDVTVDGRSKVS
jgi:4-carboxymuconolactone decarboxylase